MSFCPVQTNRALLIGHEFVLFEVVICCLSIAQRALPFANLFYESVNKDKEAKLKDVLV
jgi:hypothetical protein